MDQTRVDNINALALAGCPGGDGQVLAVFAGAGHVVVVGPAGAGRLVAVVVP